MELPREVDVSFRSFSAWEDWRDKNGGFDGIAFREGLVAHVLKFGLREPLTGLWVPPDQIERRADLREGLMHRGIISRQRAVMRVIEQTFDTVTWHNLRIFAPEATTPLALRLRGIFPKFIGSEFTLDEQKRRDMYPIPLEDLTALSLPSDMFDLVTTNEVLEHIPDLDAGLAEMARVLKPGGWHIGTHPLVQAQHSIVTARLEGGTIIHLTEPEYHGDPFNDGGSLVFELPAWDILARARVAGFSDAWMRMVISQYHGYLANRHMGIFVLCCRK